MAQIFKFKHRSNATFYSSLAATIVIGVLGGNFLFDHQDQIIPKSKTFSAQTIKHATSCNIKGNISINTGERIFHVPGQEYYSRTIITPRYGERWFCSEQEAYAAGWRKARTP